MYGQDNGLTLEGLAQRLEALERENAELRQEVSVLRGSQQTRPSEVPASQELGTEFEGRVSRRDLLSKAGAAAVAAVAAGTLLNARTAKADHLDAGIRVNYVETHQVQAHTEGGADGLSALFADTKSDNWAAIEGQNFGSDPAVRGTSESSAVAGIATGTSGIGVEGTSQGSNGTGVKGTGRYGVWGVSNQAGFYGVFGRNDTSGGGTGVWGVSANGIGVHGDGSNGVYGTSSKTGFGAVYGKHTGSDGNGVVGDGTGGSAGVLGRNSGGIGVRGESSSSDLGAIEGHNDGLGSGVVGVGRVGMLGFSHTDGWNAVWGRHTTNGRGIAGDSAKGTGVYGESGGGYGGEFKGGKAQLRVVPKPAGTTGPPTGAHAKGEVYMDSTATLFVCVAGGNPATWRKVTTTAI